MILSSIPTDNLYKFVALSGLVLVLFALTYPVQIIYKLQLEVADLQTEVALLKQESRDAKRDVTLLERDAAATPEKFQALRARNDSLGYKAIRASGKLDKSRLLLNQLRFMLLICFVCALTGVRLTWWGFQRWYYRIQRPADQKAQSESPGEDT